MSWKIILSAGLLCVVASPVFAQPTLSVTTGGTIASNYLNAAGQWVWNTQISNSNPVPTGSSPLAAELGFTATGSALISASNLSTGAGVNFDTLNPGTSIFGWETPGVNSNGKPVGIETNCASGCTVNNSTNQVFSALGSIDFATVGPHPYIQITTGRPVVTFANPNTSSTLTVSGAYTGKGRIAELNNTSAVNYDTFNNVFVRNARGGDSDLNGTVNFSDYLNHLFVNYNQPGVKTWLDGDYDGNGTVNFNDYLILFTTYNSSYSVGSGAGSGASLAGGSAVPEPASIVLIGLGLLGGLGLIRRKR